MTRLESEKNRVLGPIHTDPFLYKNEKKNLSFVTVLALIRTKKEVFENVAAPTTRLQRYRFFRSILYKTGAMWTDSLDTTKTDTYKNGAEWTD